MKKLIILISFVIVAGSLMAQQNITMYNMHRVQQSMFVNPVSNNTYSLNIGGLIVPVFGQIPPAMHFNYANNTWMFTDFFHKGLGSKADSLVFDIDRMTSKINNKNHIRFETDLELLTVGLNLGTMFLSFSINEKLRGGVSIPGDFVSFLAYGNRSFVDADKPMDFSPFNVNFTHYHEFAFGMSAVAKDKIKVGGRFKLLFGGMNVSSDIKNLSLYTDPESVYVTAAANMAVHASLPFQIEYVQYEDSSRIIMPDDIDINPVSYLINPRNFGFAFDLGMSYDINDKISAFASLNDIGMISWNTNPFNLVSDGEFLFRGIEIKFFNDSLTMQESLKNLGDSIMDAFQFEGNNFNYITMLPSSIYLGGTYKIMDKLHVGALYRGELYNKSLLSAVSFSLNSNLTSWFSGHLSYTLAHNNFANIGVGFTLRGAIFQYYMVTDNILGVFFPHKAQNFNFRMGCNIVFGYKEKSISSTYY
ncbi:MAG: hypothetical protein GX879_04375 [Bacteroidales bacterium]|nr:hypothetical protein [Bacteroidales bacterium]